MCIYSLLDEIIPATNLSFFIIKKIYLSVRMVNKNSFAKLSNNNTIHVKVKKSYSSQIYNYYRKLFLNYSKSTFLPIYFQIQNELDYYNWFRIKENEIKKKSW